MANESKFKRVLLKLSGEALANDSREEVFDFDYIKEIVRTVIKAHDAGCQVAIVVGAGNIWRGKNGVKMDSVRADDMGMLATVINAIALRDMFIGEGCDAVAMSSVEIKEFAELYTRDAAVRAMNEGSIVIIGGGLGVPFFSTDTAAVQRAAELDVDITLMGKNIDGIYNMDPAKHPEAVMYRELDYNTILKDELKAIDYTAAAFAKDRKMVIRAFGIKDPENIYRVVTGEELGTLISC